MNPENPYARGNSFNRPVAPTLPTTPVRPANAPDPIIPVSSAPQPKRSRWPIFAVIGALMVIGIIVLAVVLSSIKSPEQLFNMYANYLISGETSTNSPTQEYSLNIDKYYIKQMLSSDDAETRTNYFANLNKLWSDFKSKYNGADYDDLQSSIDNTEEALLFLTEHASSTPLTFDQILSSYVNDGESATRDYINSAYNGIYSDSKSKYGQYAADNKVRYDLAMLERIKLYDANGCIVRGQVDELCTYYIEPEEIEAIGEDVTKLQYDTIIDSATKKLLSESTVVREAFTRSRESDNE